MKSAGIYKISCSANSKFYIGSSINIATRFKQHKSKLEKNCHVNRHLQSAWNKYGESSFTFEILEVIQENSVEIVRNLEQKMLDSYLAEDWSKLFNIAITVDMTITSDETKAGIVERWANPEYKDKLVKKFRKTGAGVYKTKNNKYEAKIKHDGKNIHLGTYKTEAEALSVRLKAEKYYWENGGKYEAPNKKAPSVCRVSGSGVRLIKKDNKYVATISVNGKAKHLGSFNTEKEAVDARLKAEEYYWAEDFVEDAEKEVSLKKLLVRKGEGSYIYPQKNGRYKACAYQNKKMKTLGTFDTYKEALQAQLDEVK
jgi:group I intron endonuclease